MLLMEQEIDSVCEAAGGWRREVDGDENGREGIKCSMKIYRDGVGRGMLTNAKGLLCVKVRKAKREIIVVGGGAKEVDPNSRN